MEFATLTPDDLESLKWAAVAVAAFGAVFGLVIAPWFYWFVVSSYRFLTQPKKEQFK